MNELLSKNYFSRYKYQLSYLAKFMKHTQREWFIIILVRMFIITKQIVNKTKPWRWTIKKDPVFNFERSYITASIRVM